MRREKCMKRNTEFKHKKLLYTLGSLVSSFALMITALNVNTTCAFIAHQPEVPDSAKKLRKF